MKLTYVMAFVADMDAAIAFYRDTLGLTLRFASPDWSEFDTGSTTLALHAASPGHPAGTTRLGFSVPDMQLFGAQLASRGLQFTQPPRQEHGVLLAEFAGADGVRHAVSAPLHPGTAT
jgi:catechol 2,3-dioxygenase-like lactoylglutathione lyase family enzyme